jgi:hypothetical protein
LIDMTAVDERGDPEAERESKIRLDKIMQGWTDSNEYKQLLAMDPVILEQSMDNMVVTGETEDEYENDEVRLRQLRKNKWWVRYVGGGIDRAGFFEQVIIVFSYLFLKDFIYFFLEQYRVLSSRLLFNMWQDRLNLWGSLLEVVIMGCVIGIIFWQMPDTPAGIQSRKSVLYLTASLQSYLCLMFVIYKLTDEYV